MSPSRRNPDAQPATAACGRLGEDWAARWLAGQGWRCEARNLRTRGGEIDLLIRRGSLWVAVEVKTRRNHTAPERTVDDRALERLGAALRSLAPQLRPKPKRLRVDVVAVRWTDGAPEIRRFPGPELLFEGWTGCHFCAGFRLPRAPCRC